MYKEIATLCLSVEKGILCIVILDHTNVRCQLFQLLTGLVDHGYIFFVHALSHGKLCDATDHAVITYDGNAVLQRLIPEILVSFNVDIYLLRIINDQWDSCSVRYCIFVIRIIELSLIQRVDCSLKLETVSLSIFWTSPSFTALSIM